MFQLTKIGYEVAALFWSGVSDFGSGDTFLTILPLPLLLQPVVEHFLYPSSMDIRLALLR